MAKFNRSTVGSVSKPESDSVNMAGGASYSREYKKEVASVLLASMMNGDKYYQSEASRLKQIEDLIQDGVKQGEAEFLAKAMVYTRMEGKLRSVSHVVAVNLAQTVKGQEFMRKALVKSFNRPDDMTETASLYFSKNPNKSLPNALRRAYKDALEDKFDAYQLKKYLGETSAVKLRDIVKLAHPSPDKFEDKEIFKKVIEGTLENIQTAQTVNASSTGESRKETYISMLKERKLGYMALIKNLKNILETGLNVEELKLVTDSIKNDRGIKNSMMLPFRFYDAYRELNSSSIAKMQVKKVAEALEYAFGVSTLNTGLIKEGETIGVLHDCSGSMGGGSKSPFHNGMIIAGAMLQGLPKGDSIVYLWSDRAEEVKFGGSAFDFIDKTRTYGGGTDLGTAFRKLTTDKTVLDKIVITTDMQAYGLRVYDYVKEYRKISPNVKILFWNLSGYAGGTPMKLNDNILEVSGFSDKMFDVIPLMWEDKDALIKKIEEVEL